MSDFGLTPELLALVKKHEGWSSKPYRCPAGFPTIGYGHLLPTPPGLDTPPITKEQGEVLLKQDLDRTRSGVVALAPLLLREREPRLAALIDFAYNLGVGRFRASTLRRKVLKRDWPGAAREIRKWCYAGGKKLPGLVLRRAIESRWLEG